VTDPVPLSLSLSLSLHPVPVSGVEPDPKSVTDPVPLSVPLPLSLSPCLCLWCRVWSYVSDGPSLCPSPSLSVPVSGAEPNPKSVTDPVPHFLPLSLSFLVSAVESDPKSVADPLPLSVPLPLSLSPSLWCRV
jgi:hypothetical protein